LYQYTVKVYSPTQPSNPWTCDREVVGSNLTRGYCVGLPTPTQRAIPPGSVNEYQQKLGSKRAYHALYPWSCSICWYPAESYRNGNQRRPM